MAISFLAGLSVAARTAYPIILRGVSEGLSGNAIQRVLSIVGPGLRRNIVQDVVRRIKDIQLANTQLKFIRKDRAPNPANLRPALHKIRRAFSFTIEVRGTAIDTGENILQHVTVTTDAPFARGLMEQEAIDVVQAGKRKYEILVESALLIGGLRAGTEGVL